MASKVIYTRVPDYVHDELFRIAQETGLSITVLVTMILCEAMNLDDPRGKVWSYLREKHQEVSEVLAEVLASASD